MQECRLSNKHDTFLGYHITDNWQFEVRLEAVDNSPCRSGGVKVIESAGKSPEQYPPYEG